MTDPGLPALDRLFARCAGARGVLLAVSGGSDSTALALLYAAWAEAAPAAPPAVVASVDHGLRADAAGDVAAVAVLAARLGLPFRALRIDAPPPSGNLQAWARERRYALLAEAARMANCDVVLTAHTLDDQAETLLLRLARGSGVRGLAAMAPDAALDDGIRLVRPLLGIARATLREALLRRGIGWRDDPSNTDPRYARVRLRALMPQLAAEGLDAPRLAATAAQLGRAAAAIDWAVGRLAGEAARVDPGGFVRLAPDVVAAAPAEIRLRLLSELIRWVGGGRYGPSLEALAALDAELDAEMPARSLGGTLTFGVAGAVVIAREPGRDGLPAVELPPGATVTWDRRIRFRRTADDTGRITIAPASRPALAGLARSGRTAAPLDRVLARMIATVPAVWRDGRCLAIPALALWRDEAVRAAIHAEFRVAPPAPVVAGAGSCGEAAGGVAFATAGGGGERPSVNRSRATRPRGGRERLAASAVAPMFPYNI